MTIPWETRLAFGPWVALCLISGVSACSSPSSSSCPPILRVAPPLLVLPSPGATGVSANVGELLIFQYRTSDIVTLTTQAGVPVAAATMVPAPTPLPSSLPTPMGLVYGKISIPTLSPTTTYVVVNAQTFPGPCGFIATDNLGAFTTR
jgi:hypothetical protein